MDNFFIIIALIIGIILGGILIYFTLKSNHVSRSSYDDVNQKYIKSQAENQNLFQHLEEYRYNIQKQTELSDQTILEKQNLFGENVELKSKNDHLQAQLIQQKEEIQSIQEQTKLQFEKVANQILEEKTEKFTNMNQLNLKNILEPFEKNINELKKTVNDTYDKEAKERFSLGEKVRELKDLNQQISDDAKKLTRALKGESKTQGNWGEMILESILEKSGLIKNQEYFLEHQLRDEDNKALFSEFSGKKMRPDAVIKYPDNRNVIIDSKVSLTAFIEMVDEEDADVFKIKQQQHLASVKNHINQLSQKAYDDYDKSLDFVMMFIPNEAAYIAAIQAEPHLWSYAYDKRILLLNPTNLITSLKLIEDLWKREYQNKNAMEIADRGAKLYDKFVGFVDNLEKIGKNIEIANNSYQDAYKQLSTGKDNLVTQTLKLKDLGIKNKKQLPQSLVDQNDYQSLE
ncbi:DNA recombination protein RmuC [Chryseobacterium sp. T1]